MGRKLMEVHLEHDWLTRSTKVWFIERGPSETRYFVPSPEGAGDTWMTRTIELGMAAPDDIVPLVLSDDMLHELKKAVNEADLPQYSSDANKALVDVLRNEGERNNQRVDKMLDALIASKQTIVVPGGATLQRTGEAHG
jgi:hypothetical protein